MYMAIFLNIIGGFSLYKRKYRVSNIEYNLDIDYGIDQSSNDGQTGARQLDSVRQRSRGLARHES